MAASENFRREAWQQAVAAYQRADYPSAARALKPLKRLGGLPAEVELLAGIVALHMDESDEAEQRLARAAVELPGNADAWLALGDARSRLGRHEPARDAYRQCLACAPNHVAALQNLGLACQRMARDAEALACFDRVLELAPDMAAIALTRARLLTRMGRREAAESAYESLLQQCPADTALTIEYAEFLEQANRVVAADAVLPDPQGLDDELAVRATEVRARLLERSGRIDDALRLVERLDDGPAWERLGYRKGALLDRLGRYGEAIDAFAIANQARSRDPRFQNAGATAFRDCLDDKIRKGVQSSENPADADDSSSPVFLVGLPRSGTTLLGSMLAAHPSIRLLDEPETLRVLEAALLGGASPGAARSAYWQQAIGQTDPPGGKVVVDKNPLHIPQLDAVATAFPRATVVLLLRHPYDAALSCYMQDFAPNPATAHFLDLASTASVCARLLDLVRDFEEALPGNVIRIHYEHLVADFEAQVTRVLGGIGLEWHPDVAAYIERVAEAGLVRTPSHAQITQSLYKDAVGRWMRYREYLEGFREHLGPRLADFGYSDRSPEPDPPITG